MQARPSKRKRPAGSGASSSATRRPPAGADLLDSILGGMTRTYDQMPVRTERQRQQQAAEEQLEIASHYSMVRIEPAAREGGKPEDKLACRNPECRRREFDTDWRQGDRICRHCGCVQNTRSVESHEEEKRTFADDDNKEAKKRAEKSTGRGGGSVGQSNLAQAHTRALEGGDLGEGEMSTRDLHRIEAYRGKLSGLADALQLSKAIEQEGAALCEVFVRKQLEHDGRCQAAASGATCRLSLKRPSAALVAAAVLKEAMRKHGTDRLFEELKAALKSEDMDAADAKKIGRCHAIVAEVIAGAKTCRPADADDEGLEEKLGGATATEGAAEGSGGGGGGGGGGGMGGAGGAGTTTLSGGAGGAAAGTGDAQQQSPPPQTQHPSAALIPRLCDDLGLPYFVNLRATDVIEDWTVYGMPALQPKTISSLALLRAYEELVAPLVRNDPAVRHSVPEFTLETAKNLTGMTVPTLRKQMRHPQLPWPTLAVQDAALPPQLGGGGAQAVVLEHARRSLERWLLKKDGDVRRWCRQTRPRVLAACALVHGSGRAAKESAEQVAAAAAAAAAGDGSGGGGGVGDQPSASAAAAAADGGGLSGAAAAAATAPPPVVVAPLDVEAAVVAVGGDEATPETVQAAMAQMPPAAAAM